MMKNRQFLCILMIALGFTASVSAQELKIGVVDYKKVLLAHPSAEALQTEISMMVDNAAAVIAGKQEQLKKMAENIEAIKKVNTTPDGKLKESAFPLVQDINNDAGRLRRDMMVTENETKHQIAVKRTAGMKKISDEVAVLVKQANAGQCALVFDSSAVTANGTPQILDFSGAVDLTDAVIALLPK